MIAYGYEGLTTALPWVGLGSANMGFLKKFGNSVSDWFTGRQSARINSAAQIKTAAALNEQQKGLDLWRSRNLPSAQVQGYRSAGLNPILVGNQSPSVVSSHNASVDSSGGNLAAVGSLVNSAAQLAQLKPTIENLDAMTGKAVADAESNRINAGANATNANTNQWTVFDAKSIGEAGFHVKFLGIGGSVKRISTLRLNKVTGETYDALTGLPVKVLNGLPSGSVNSARDAEVKVSPLYDVRLGQQAPRSATHNPVPWR